MKKIIITLLFSILFVSGCSIIKVSSNSIGDIFNTVLYVDNNLANTYGNMDPAAAAQAIQDLDDITLACKILSAMSQKKMAAIMNEMPSEFAADVTEKIHALSKS